MNHPTPSQQAAIVATDRHLLVAAGAGTGKTSTVVGRILYLLGAEVGGARHPSPVELQEIGAITYTNAAAADLKRKLREELREAGLGDIAYQVDNARIGTIHGFCGDILRESALRSGRNPSVKVLEEGEGGSLAAESVRDALIAALDEGMLPGLNQLLARRRQDEVEGWVLRLLGDGDRLRRILRSKDLGEGERALAELADAARLMLERRLEDEGSIDFDRMIVWTRDLLRNDAAVRTMLQRRLHTLIVDEFQDVDPVQKEIAWLLGDPESGRADTTRLMLVGDPKQSIYRFRGADVTVWRSVERAFADRKLGQVVALQESFRSVAPILAFVDATVGPVLDQPIDGKALQDFEVEYRSVKAVATTEGPANRAVEILVVPPDADGDALNAEPRRMAEAEAVARRVLELHGEGVPYREMAALFAGWGDVDLYQQALERAEVPTYALRGEGFYERREVVDLVLALEAVRNPRDDRALLGFLRSPFVGVKDETLLQIAWQGQSPQWNSLGDMATGEDDLLAAGIVLLREQIALRDRIPIHELLERLLNQSGYLAHLILQGKPASQAIANVRKFLRFARQQAGAGVGDFLQIIREIRDREDREGDERLYGPTDDVMTLTTIHSAKGLEWHTVFWCDLERKPGGGGGWGKDACLIGRDRLALKDPDAGKDDPQPPEWMALKAMQDAESAAEHKRLWYVAATRAKQRLILAGVSGAATSGNTPAKALLGGLTVPVTEGAEVEYRGQGDRAFVATVRLARPQPPAPAVELPDPWAAPLPAQLPAQLAPLPVPVGPARNSATSLMSHRRCPRRHWLRYVAGLKEPQVPRDGQGYLSAIARGQIVHDVLEQLQEDADADALLEAAIGKWDDSAAPPDSPAGSDMREMLREEIRLIAGHAEYRVVADHPTNRRELPFVHLVEADRHIQGKLDLAAPEGNGLVLLDVKTARGDAAHAAEVARHYDIQRSAYVTAAESIGGMPVTRFAFQFSRAETQISTTIGAAEREAARREVERELAQIDGDGAPLTAHAAECGYCGFKQAGWCPGVSGEVD